jgi:hypothetical protein
MIGLATMATLLAALFLIYQSYKTYMGGADQTQPRAMAMAAGR